MFEKKPIKVDISFLEVMKMNDSQSYGPTFQNCTTTFNIRPTSNGKSLQNDILPVLKNLNPEMAGRISKLLGEIIQYEDALLGWLSQSEQNAKEFILNPVNALRNAVSNLPPELIEELENINNQLKSKSFAGEG